MVPSSPPVPDGPKPTRAPGASANRVGTRLGRDAAKSAFTSLPESVRRELLRRWHRYGPRMNLNRPPAPVPKPGMAVGAPDFVGIGVPKAGTTWWFSLIASHPEVHVENQKELRYFGPRVLDEFGRTGDFEDTADAYRAWFPRPEGTKSGEWTPNYLYTHQLPPVLRRAAPGCKLVVLLRDPVERYRSHVSIHTSSKRMQVHRHLALDRGYYSAALRPWEAVFSPSDMLILQFEKCRAAPATHLATTFRFLGVDDTYDSAAAGIPVNKTARKQSLSPELERVLVGLYEADVLALAGRYPQIDLHLWPNFAHLAARD